MGFVIREQGLTLDGAPQHTHQLPQFAYLFLAHMLVDGITFDKVILQYLSGPDAECSASLALNAISDRDDYIKTIDFRRAIFILSIMQKMHITFFFQFTFTKSIVDVAGNNRLVFLKQFCHLCLRQPHRIIFQADIYLCLPVFRLIYYYLVFIHKFRFI